MFNKPMVKKMKTSPRVLAIRENRNIRNARKQEIEDLRYDLDAQMSEYATDILFQDVSRLEMLKKQRKINNTERQIRKAESFYALS